jgi:hypothetical protein
MMVCARQGWIIRHLYFCRIDLFCQLQGVQILPLFPNMSGGFVLWWKMENLVCLYKPQVGDVSLSTWLERNWVIWMSFVVGNALHMWFVMRITCKVKPDLRTLASTKTSSNVLLKKFCDTHWESRGARNREIAGHF